MNRGEQESDNKKKNAPRTVSHHVVKNLFGCMPLILLINFLLLIIYSQRDRNFIACALSFFSPLVSNFLFFFTQYMKRVNFTLHRVTIAKSTTLNFNTRFRVKNKLLFFEEGTTIT